MKQLATLLALVSLAYPSHAASPRACRTAIARATNLRLATSAHFVNHRAAQPHFVITAFAVPVAVPVAPYAPYWYGVSDYHDSQRAFSRSAPTRTGAEARNGETASEVTAHSAPFRPGTTHAQQSLLAQKCTSCHGRTSPKQGFSLVDPLSLSGADRLRAIRAVVSGEMPPEGETPLTNSDRNAILRELTAD